jgi:SAM-dependent methyltransferase
MSRRKHIHDHYEPRIVPGRASHEVHDWADAASQEARYRVLADNVPLDGKSLLDVGCGLGDLFGFLRSRGVAVRYVGVDIVAKMADAARRRFPEGRFVQGDVFADHPFGQERFNVVFCSGVFNLNLGNNRQFLPAALGRQFELADEHAVFNLLHHRTTERYEHCAYFDPAEVVAMVVKLAADVRVIDDYLHNDFTVICRL